MGVTGWSGRVLENILYIFYVLLYFINKVFLYQPIGDWILRTGNGN